MSKPTFAMKVSAPKLDKAAVRVELLAALREHGKSAVKVFETTTASWSGDKPKFEPIISLSEGEGAGLDLALSGEGKAVDKWFWLDRGTAVRRALMSPDWHSKTGPDVVGSGPGSGKVIFVSRKLSLPGIKARNWSKIIKREMKPIFRADMKAALDKGLVWAKKNG